MFERSINPFLQAGVVLIAMIVFMGLGSVASNDPRFAWVTVCAMLLFFALFNALLSIPAKHIVSYWWKSVAGFTGLAVIGGVLAYWISGLSIDEAGSARWLYVVFAFGYLVFISIIQMVKFIIGLAQRKDKELRGEK